MGNLFVCAANKGETGLILPRDKCGKDGILPAVWHSVQFRTNLYFSSCSIGFFKSNFLKSAG